MTSFSANVTSMLPPTAGNGTSMMPPGGIPFITPEQIEVIVSLARQGQNAQYVLMVTISAWVWDIAVSIDQEYSVLHRGKFTLPKITYMFSRLATAVYIALAFSNAFVRCAPSIMALETLSFLAGSANTFMMYLRARAVFAQSRWIVHLFTLLWVACVAGYLVSAYAPQDVVLLALGSDQCASRMIRGRVILVGVVISAFNDTLIFFAITWRVLKTHTFAEAKSGLVKAFFRGDGMGNISKVLLQTGQLYYLVTVCANITTIVEMQFTSSPAFHSVFALPNCAITNAMACRVFRHLSLGHLLSGLPTVQTLGDTRVTAPIRMVPMGSSMGSSSSGTQTNASYVTPVTYPQNFTVKPEDKRRESGLVVRIA